MMKYSLQKNNLKLISVILSFIFWLYILNSEKVKFEKIIEVDYILPQDMVFASKPLQEATFLLEGPRSFVNLVMKKNHKIYINLNTPELIKKLNFSVELNPNELNLPLGMVVDRVLPRKISIRLEKKVRQKIPLKFEFSGDLPQGMELEKAFLDPEQVEVEGPASVLLALKEIKVSPIDVKWLIGNDHYMVGFELPDERMALVSKKKIKLHYNLKVPKPNLVLKNQPIKFPTDHLRLISDFQVAELKLFLTNKYGVDQVSQAGPIQVVADIPEDARGRVKVPLRVVLPPHIHLVEVIPKSIIVNME